MFAQLSERTNSNNELNSMLVYSQYKKFKRVIIALSLFGLFINSHLAQTQELDIDYSQTSLSGLSSGGYMATQFHLAHADSIKGVGIIAAGPYYCAKGSIGTALSDCLYKTPDNFSPIMSLYHEPNNESNLAKAKDIRKSKVWLLHGLKDTRIAKSVSDALYEQYKSWVNTDNLVYINNKDIAHLFPTIDSGSKCDEPVAPFIGACNFDAAGELLTHIYGELRSPVPKNQIEQHGELIKLSQSSLANIESTGLHQEAFIFLPKACSKGATCKLHVSFHGCNQSIDNVGDKYATMTGLNEWAANNNMIVMYPQIRKSAMFPMNPQACWDWWGYTDKNYANKDGKQIKAIHQMILNLSQFSFNRIQYTQ